MDHHSFTKRPAFFLLIMGLLLLGLQAAYFISRYRHLDSPPPQDFDLVLTYSDLASMEPALHLALSQHKPLFVSQAPWEPTPFPKSRPAELLGVHMDTSSSTTDQNARRAANFIKSGPYKRVVLDVGWFHVPRALFLTRLYLLGSGVEVIPCSKTPLPDRWWSKRLFWMELYKFWGSLGRVGLAFIGYETGPKGPPQWQKNISSGK